MKKIKLKLKYNELQVLDNLLTNEVHQLELSGYANKAIMALLVDWGLKHLKPHTYLAYFNTKSFSLPLSVACGIIHLFQYVAIEDMYTQNVMRTIVMNIEPKLIRS